MVPLVRGAPPQVLLKKGGVWRNHYLAQCSGAKRPPRPDNKRYGHADVRTELLRMSHGKCFYCERNLSEKEAEVDHSIEVAERPDLAFDWGNLYLACGECNGAKAPNRQIPVADCVDPCDPGERPADHLSFTDECIAPRDARGGHTIRKYRLNRDELDLRRSRWLKHFLKTYTEILVRMNREGRAQLSDEERELLRLYCDPSQPFSLMMSVHLARAGL